MPLNNSRNVISVFGSSAPLPGSLDYQMSQTVGRLLAETGFAVQTGGYGGVMAAVSQGAAEAGGHVIGITSRQIEQFRPTPANQWVKEERKLDTAQERLLYLVANCDGAIVMPGGIGTLAELALSWNFAQVGEIAPRPIVAIGELWQRTLATFTDEAYIAPAYQILVKTVLTPEEAVQIIKNTVG